jgi:hypothetical protein
MLSNDANADGTRSVPVAACAVVAVAGGDAASVTAAVLDADGAATGAVATAVAAAVARVRRCVVS